MASTDDGAEDHGLRAEAVVEPAADERADRAGDGQHDAEDPELGRAPAEHARAVDSAEREERHQRVLIDHVGDEKATDAVVTLASAMVLFTCAKPFLDRFTKGELRSA